MDPISILGEALSHSLGDLELTQQKHAVLAYATLVEQLRDYDDVRRENAALRRELAALRGTPRPLHERLTLLESGPRTASPPPSSGARPGRSPEGDAA